MERRPGETVEEAQTLPPWRVLTIPNLISFIRLLGVPLFIWLFFTDRLVPALVVLVVGGFSDWVDGYAARALGQVSRLGQLMDPLVDRLYIAATVLVFTIAGVVPWQFTALLVLRELFMSGCLAVLRRYGYGPLPVHYLGKTATFVLLMAFPFLLLGELSGTAGAIGQPIGWSLAIWGGALYWCAGALYAVHTRRLVRQARQEHEAVA